ncbi:RNA-binding protein 48 [Aricia agestis]|uniref:RNA-binding protein 48 n=1 Tax=Aricia agestis TaxID=91739 RepID=UPI001C201DD3|nr:RNA-binding protein 48 [Aricia agestis]
MSEEKIILPHHEQQSLCTSRLPYRQGRKLTAVKVYTVTTESNHLLVFGVPSLNLRQEAKSLFMKFGRLRQFTLSPNHAAEVFTETYHAQYERIQSARVAKKMLDTKNFYGGSLHVCYAPEFETIEETKQKIFQRQRDVLNRLRNLEKEKTNVVEQQQAADVVPDEEQTVTSNKLNMGEINTFNMNNEIVVPKKKKRKSNLSNVSKNYLGNCAKTSKHADNIMYATSFIKTTPDEQSSTEIEIIDATSVDTEVVTNINESLNYNNFGNEVIRKVPDKPLNKIIYFNVNKNHSKQL